MNSVFVLQALHHLSRFRDLFLQTLTSSHNSYEHEQFSFQCSMFAKNLIFFSLFSPFKRAWIDHIREERQ